MIKFSNDTDILKYEPDLFGDLHLPWQVLAQGAGATVSGTTLTVAGFDFNAAGVQPGGVIYLRDEATTVDGSYEIVSVDSPSELTISVLRIDTEAQPIAPMQGDNFYFRISTFDPQAAEAAVAITNFFDIKPGSAGSDITVEDLLGYEVFCQLSTFAVISGVYAMLAGQEDDEHLWEKSHYYKRRFGDARTQVRLGIDIDSDGIAEKTTHGGAIRLTRD
jgi:hypothetical protein